MAKWSEFPSIFNQLNTISIVFDASMSYAIAVINENSMQSIEFIEKILENQYNCMSYVPYKNALSF